MPNVLECEIGQQPTQRQDETQNDRVQSGICEMRGVLDHELVPEEVVDVLVRRTLTNNFRGVGTLVNTDEVLKVLASIVGHYRVVIVPVETRDQTIVHKMARSDPIRHRVERPHHELGKDHQAAKEIVQPDKDTAKNQCCCGWLHETDKQLSKVAVDCKVEGEEALLK